MHYIISIVLPILLLILAGIFIRRNYQSYLHNWRHELTRKKVLYYAVVTNIKSIILFSVIIGIHNYFHSDNNLEVVLFVLLYFILAIFQSAYSMGGFISRMKYIYDYIINMFKKSNREAIALKDKFLENIFHKYSLIVKIIIVISFLAIFIPNIGLFVLTNMFYFIVILSLLFLSVFLNNVIYFGLVSLMIFQYDPLEISLVDVNYIVLFLSYFVILVGIVLETRMDNRMVRIVASRMIKDINFSRGYVIVYSTKQIIVHQNKINGNYYIYFRLKGLVVVFESMFDAKLSNYVVRKMIRKGRQYLVLNGVNMKEYQSSWY